MISKYFAYNKKVCIIYADTTSLLNDIIKIQNLPNSFSEIIGKFYTASGMMAFSDIKEESEEIIVQISGGGVSGMLYSVSKLDNKNIRIKGFIENTKIDFDNYDNISEIIGQSGNLMIIKNNKYTKLGYKGITPLISGNIVDDLKKYYENSTQKPAFMNIEVFENNGELKCVGYLITFMPDASCEDVFNIEKSITNISFKDLAIYNKSDDEMVRIITGDERIEMLDENIKIEYSCDCSRDKYKDMFYTLKKSELEEILGQEEKINVVCQYCNKSYDFSRDEIEEIINKLK